MTMSATLCILPRTAARKAEERASAIEQARRAVRREVIDLVATGEAGFPMVYAMATAHTECPGTFADVTEADIDAGLAWLSEQE